MTEQEATMSIPDLPEPEWREVTVTCHTEGCGNAGHALTVSVTGEAVGSCGACGQPITDITDAPTPDDDADQGAASTSPEGNPS